MAVALAGVIVLVPIGLWTQRKPIARDFVDRTLRADGVRARYTIADLGLGRQRLTDVSIGDPAAPDLTAESVELTIGYGLGWPGVRAVKARGVRLRGRLVDGRLTLGSLDRLLPAGGGGPFTLPDLRVDLADTAMRLATPAGSVALAVTGKGNLANGFDGRIAARSDRLATGGCIIAQPSARLAIRIADRQPHVSGPIAAARADCGAIGVARPQADLTATLAEALAPVALAARLTTGAVSRGPERAERLSGNLDYDRRDERDRRGTLRLLASAVRTREGSARSLGLDGRYRFGAAVALRAGSARPVRFEGIVTAGGMAITPQRLAAVARLGRAGGATPAGPLLAALSQAASRAGRDADGRGDVAFDGDWLQGASGRPLRGEFRLAGARLTSRSGAKLRLADGDGLRIDAATGAMQMEGTGSLDGGGFPSARLRVRQAAGDVLTGELILASYVVDGARLALTPLAFRRDPGGAVRFATTVTLDGPLGDGRVTGLSLPIDGRVGVGVTINPACVPLRFASLAIAGVRLGATRLPLCPVGGAMVRAGDGALTGGMAIPRPRLNGRVGSQALEITADALRVDIGTPGFTADALAVRLGAGDAPTRLDVARLAGRVDAGGVGGRFEDAKGRIANVPLLLSGGNGQWRLAGGRLALNGALAVADADPAPRYQPLASQNVTLALAGGVIRGAGTLREPKSGLAIAEVTLRHDLAAGRGGAALDVPGITFGPAFQPEALTRLTLGVVANVAGTVRGRGTIAWSPQGVTSQGDFATEGTDLAAVFGPVTGIRGSIHFSDLLGLTTPPGQLVTVAAFNPGIAVEGGVIGYQLLPGQKVAVGGGKWPFSGGSLILEPTILDFGQPVERRMTFRVEGMEAGSFVSQFDFRNIAVTGTFDGVLPMIFDQSGGRITGGRLVVRKGGGTLAYVGELTDKDLGMFGKLAFDALKSIRYDNLTIELDGALDSEIVSRILFTGTNENPVEKKKAKGLLRNLTGLPFKFNIVVRAPFRGLTSSASAFVNPGGLLGGAVAPAKPATPAVQPPLSEDKR